MPYPQENNRTAGKTDNVPPYKVRLWTTIGPKTPDQ